MNILGIDFGQKNIGLAWMQEGLDLILPYGNIRQNKREDIPSELLRLIKEEGIHKIVLGLPLTLDDGTENLNTKRVRAFGSALAEASELPVVFVDERLSSQAADDMGGEASRDEKAAMVILQNYQFGK